MKVHLAVEGRTACGMPISTLPIQTDAFLSEYEWDDLDTIKEERGIEASYCSTCAKTVPPCSERKITMAKGIMRLVTRVRRRIQEEINENTTDCRYSRGLSSEGYMGGYRDALDDVLLALNGVTPHRRNGWWKDKDND